MSEIEHWIDQHVAEAEDTLTRVLGEPDHEEEHTELLQEIVGLFTDQLQGAVQAFTQIRDLLGELTVERLTVAQVAAAHRIASDAADHLRGQ